MLERPSNIFERVQKCYKTFKRFITCYNGLYDNVIRCANRSNILFLTCCVTCCMTCLNGLPRALNMTLNLSCDINPYALHSVFVGHLEISALASRHQHRDWHRHRHSNIKLSFTQYKSCFEFVYVFLSPIQQLAMCSVMSHTNI